MQAVNLHKKLFYYRPSRGVRMQCLHRLSVSSVELYYQLACLLPAAPYYRKYFKMRFESLEKDKVTRH